jgi:hypothetical protein
LGPALRGETVDFLAEFLPRNSLYIFMIRPHASAASPVVEVRPKLNRKLLSASSFFRPIASSVGDGWLDPLAHADPVEQQTPARSNAIISTCPSTPGKVTFDT